MDIVETLNYLQSYISDYVLRRIGERVLIDLSPDPEILGNLSSENSTSASTGSKRSVFIKSTQPRGSVALGMLWMRVLQSPHNYPSNSYVYRFESHGVAKDDRSSLEQRDTLHRLMASAVARKAKQNKYANISANMSTKHSQSPVPPLRLDLRTERLRWNITRVHRDVLGDPDYRHRRPAAAFSSASSSSAAASSSTSSTSHINRVERVQLAVEHVRLAVDLVTGTLRISGPTAYAWFVNRFRSILQAAIGLTHLDSEGYFDPDDTELDEMAQLCLKDKQKGSETHVHYHERTCVGPSREEMEAILRPLSLDIWEGEQLELHEELARTPTLRRAPYTWQLVRSLLYAWLSDARWPSENGRDETQKQKRNRSPRERLARSSEPQAERSERAPGSAECELEREPDPRWPDRRIVIALSECDAHVLATMASLVHHTRYSGALEALFLNARVNARQTMPELRAEVLRALRSEHSAQLELFLEYAFFARVRVPERPFATNLIALLPADDDDEEAAVAPGKGAREERRAADSGAESRAAATGPVPVWKRRGGQVLVLSGPLTAQRLVEDASLLVQLIDLHPSDVRYFEHDFLDFATPF